MWQIIVVNSYTAPSGGGLGVELCMEVELGHCDEDGDNES